jgi:N-acetylglucosamine kinase-like BadF-type ATPase
MSFILGLDGGGTKTRCILTDLHGQKVYGCSGGPSNFLAIGIKNACKNIFSVVKDCVKKSKISCREIDIVLLGTAGAGRKNDAKKFEAALKKYLKEKNIIFKKFFIESDARIALEAAFSGEPGCILIAGTGSIIMGKDSAGNIYRAGGFGRYLGDEGSGYAFGRKALIAAAKEYDGRGSHTLITEMLKEKFKINSAENLITEIYNKEFDVASAAPLVLQAAELNDTAALRIVEEESEELIVHLKAMFSKIKSAELNTALMGSLLENENIYSKKLKEKIKQLKYIILKNPENESAMGAVLLAKSYLKQKLIRSKGNVKKG